MEWDDCCELQGKEWLRDLLPPSPPSPQVKEKTEVSKSEHESESDPELETEIDNEEIDVILEKETPDPPEETPDDAEMDVMLNSIGVP